MKRTAGLFLALAVCLTAAHASAAGVVYSGTRGFEKIQKGLWQLGLDNLLLVNYASSEQETTKVTTSNLRVAYMVGLTPRYFLMDNFSVGLSVNAFYELNEQTVEGAGTEATTTASDTGFMGLAVANYHIRLGNSLFLRPGVGVGYFYGKRSLPGTIAGTKFETTISGPAALIDLNLEYFASAHFSMRAGPILIMRFGNDTPEQGDAQPYTQIDAGFTAGIGYSF